MLMGSLAILYEYDVTIQELMTSQTWRHEQEIYLFNLYDASPDQLKAAHSETSKMM